MSVVAINPVNNKVVEFGDAVENSRGEIYMFVRATRVRTNGKSGKVVVLNGDLKQQEFYDRIFDLEVIDIQ